jgi:hypothetical protein
MSECSHETPSWPGLTGSVDLGVAFTYTGCGGRDLKGTKQNPKNLRTAEQTSDQSFDWPLNAAIKVGLPVCLVISPALTVSALARLKNLSE